MRYSWIIFGVLVIAMVVVLPRLRQPGPPRPDAGRPTVTPLVARPVVQRTSAPAPLPPHADSVVAFGLAQRGTPYVYAGTSPLTGFDCSGFIMYTFAHFGVAVPHSTALLIAVGQRVGRAEAQPGDIVVFTGTGSSSTPGHAGIVISRRGEVPLRFVHASSSRREPFVKVNQVENSDYERRFMQVRRVLGPGKGAKPALAATTTAAPGAAAPPPVAALPARRVAVAAAAVPALKIPVQLAKRKLPTRSRAAIKKKPAKARKTAPRKPVAAPRRQPAKPTSARKLTRTATKAR